MNTPITIADAAELLTDLERRVETRMLDGRECTHTLTIGPRDKDKLRLARSVLTRVAEEERFKMRTRR